jgi:predicted MFS family arabinose efflux permease
VLTTLLLEPLEAVGLGILLGRLIQLLFLCVLPLGLLLYCWRVWRQTTRQVQRTPEEEAHVKHRNGYLRLLLLLIMAVVGIIALY